jgi:hypothetical protein
MNKSQKLILTIGAIIAIVMGLIPPWSYTLNFQSASRSKPAGYFAIVSPPQPEQNHPAYGVRLDSNRLVIQWVVIAIAIGVGLALLRKKNNSQPSDRDNKQ